MDDQRDTRRSSCCLRSDKHQFGLPGVPREHGGGVSREVGIARRGKLCELGRQKFPDTEKARAGTYRLVFFPCFSKPQRETPPLCLHQLQNLGVTLTVVSRLFTRPSCSHLETPLTPLDGLARMGWPG